MQSEQLDPLPIISSPLTDDHLMDSVSEIKFGNNEIFASSSWDGFIRFYQIYKYGGYKPIIELKFKSVIDCQEPVLSISWIRDMSIIFCALADNTIRAYDVRTGQGAIIGQHDDCPARQVFWNENMKLLISLGFDKKIRFWPLQQQGMKAVPIFDLSLTAIPTVGDQDSSERFFAYSDIDGKIKWITWEKLRNMDNHTTKSPFQSEDSRLGVKSQTSCIGFSHDSKELGYCSVDGRACVTNFSESQDTTVKIVFKCHKSDEEVKQAYRTEKVCKFFSVNQLQYNPRSPGWFSTIGSDGQLQYWDLNRKNRITGFNFDSPLTASQVSPDGESIVISKGYDWGLGLDGLEKQFKNSINAILIEDKQLYYPS